MQHLSFDHLVEEEGIDIFDTGPKLKKKKKLKLFYLRSLVLKK